MKILLLEVHSYINLIFIMLTLIYIICKLFECIFVFCLQSIVSTKDEKTQ